jgi:hypothetical protein
MQLVDRLRPYSMVDRLGHVVSSKNLLPRLIELIILGPFIEDKEI